MKRKLWMLIALSVLVFLLGAAGCRRALEVPESEAAQPPAEESEVRVYSPDAENAILVARTIEVPGDEDELSWALREADPGILSSHAIRGDGRILLRLDADWEPTSERDEILAVYALVNTAAQFSPAGDVQLALCGSDDDLMYGGAHLVADPTLQSPGWDGEWVSPWGDLGVQPLERMGGYFTPIGWMDGTRIVGIDGDHLAVYDTAEETVDRLGVTAWSARLSPDGEKIAYIAEGGVKVCRLAAPDEPVTIYASSEPAAEGMWSLVGFSPDSEQLLFARVHEWDSTYYLYHLPTGERRELDTGLDGYFLTHGGVWLDDQQLIFNVRAVARRDGTAEYGFGMRGDLALYDLSIDSYTKITEVQDGCFVMAEGVTGPAEIAYREDCDGVRPTAGTYRPNSTEKTMFPVPAAGIIADPSGGRFVLLSEWVSMTYRSHLHLWILEGREAIGALRLRDIHEWPRVLWSPDGDRFVVTAGFRYPAGAEMDEAAEVRRSFLISVRP